MSDYDTAEIEDTELDERDARALTEYMTVIEEGGDIYSVTTESGREHRIDAREGRCTCPDHEYREARCKHLRQVAFATGERPVPAWVDTDAVDPQFGTHVTGEGPRVAATDGGRLETDDGEDSRPADCVCTGSRLEAEAGLPCWPCYRDGFDEPNRTRPPTSAGARVPDARRLAETPDRLDSGDRRSPLIRALGLPCGTRRVLPDSSDLLGCRSLGGFDTSTPAFR